MPSGINKNYLIVLFLMMACFAVAQPNVKIIASSQARIGLSTAVNVQIISKNISGPARVCLNIPQGWELEKFPGEFASVSQSKNHVRIVWLEYPKLDTIDVVFLLKLPSNQSLGNFEITGWMDYMDSGKPRKVEMKAHTFKVVKYYSRIQ
jgi:hypothetical protein